MILLEYQNLKVFLQKFTLQSGRKKLLGLKKLKILYCGHVIIMILLERKLNQKELRIEKEIKKKVVNYKLKSLQSFDPNDITQSESFKYKTKIAGKTFAADNTKDVKIAFPLKYLSSFWRTLGMPLINCELGLINMLFPLQLE